MNRLPVFSFCLALGAGLMVFSGSAVSAAAAEKRFEGQVKMKMSDGTEEQTIEYFVKGDRMRVETEEVGGEGGAMIMNMSEKTIVVLMPDEKMYMTMPLPDIAAGQSGEDKEKKPEPTGETRTILGYETKKYLIEDEGVEYEIWATDELGAFAPLGMSDESGSRGASSGALSEENFFPLLIVERKNGQEQSRVEVTEVEQKSLQDSLFEPPADYQGMQLPFGAPPR